MVRTVDNTREVTATFDSTTEKNINVTAVEALLVGKQTDGGDMLNVDTTNMEVDIGNTTHGGDITLFNTTSGTSLINFNDGATAGSFGYNHTADTFETQAPLVIDDTSTEALLIRKDSDGGDVLTVSSTDNDIIIGDLTTTGPSITFKSTDTATQSIFFNEGLDYGRITFNHDTRELAFMAEDSDRLILDATTCTLGTAVQFHVDAVGGDAITGTATINGTTGVTVSTTSVNTASKIQLTRSSTSSAYGSLYVTTITDGTSFVIYSTNASDDGSVNWFIIN